jgi:hypothetical protein
MARPVTVTISHDLGLEGARARIDAGFTKLKSQIAGGFLFKFNEEWTRSDQLTFTAEGFGQTITGVIDIFPQHVRIHAVLPDLLASIAETISGKVAREGKHLLEKK